MAEDEDYNETLFDNDDEAQDAEDACQEEQAAKERQKSTKNKKPRHGYSHDRVYVSSINYTFARVIVDKAQCLHNANTLLAESMFHLRKKTIHFLSATPFLNHPQDLISFLFQIFKAI